MEQRFQNEENEAEMSVEAGAASAMDRIVADQDLRAFTDDPEILKNAVELKGLIQRAQQWRRLRRMIVPVVMTSMGIGAVSGLLSIVPGWPTLIFLLCLGFVMAGIVSVESRRMSRALLKARKRLNEKRHIGMLVEALEIADPATRNIVMDMLTQLLPDVDAGDARLLNPRQRTILFRFLSGDRPPQVGFAGYLRCYSDFAAAALKAMPVLGGTSAIPHVEKLVASYDGRIRAAAQECLAALNARREADRVGETLLRPSSSVASVSPDVLLRPAGGEAKSGSEDLLRGSSE